METRQQEAVFQGGSYNHNITTVHNRRTTEERYEVLLIWDPKHVCRLWNKWGPSSENHVTNEGGQMGHCIESLGHILRNFLQSKIDAEAYRWHCR